VDFLHYFLSHVSTYAQGWSGWRANLRVSRLATKYNHICTHMYKYICMYHVVSVAIIWTKVQIMYVGTHGLRLTSGVCSVESSLGCDSSCRWILGIVFNDCKKAVALLNYWQVYRCVFTGV
jgi:hypothetical protein